MTDLKTVAAALARASEGSEYLDYTIQRLFGVAKPVPEYTRSLDGAMRLIPAGWSVHRLGHLHDGRGNYTSWSANLYRADQAVIDEGAVARAATAPLALCLAALAALGILKNEEATAGSPRVTRAAGAALSNRASYRAPTA